jgi:hypothetical protein
MDFRLGFGPMSREVITAICNYTHDTKRPLMIIASRNQVDAETGYVMTTPELRSLLNTLPTDYVWMCRDHCGPYFLDAEKNLSLRDAVEATKKTIASPLCIMRLSTIIKKFSNFYCTTKRISMFLTMLATIFYILPPSLIIQNCLAP